MSAKPTRARVVLGAVIAVSMGTAWGAAGAAPRETPRGDSKAPIGDAPASPEAPEDDAPSAPQTPSAETPAPDAPPAAKAAIEGPTALDAVMPSGLRVIVARDDTLPVAAVVLAVETGSEDDPSDRPGLVHALAFHLLQGNRELTPGGAASIVHDAGGITELAIGPAQVRYESLVPVSRLDRAIWVEAQRMRAPTVSDELWSDTLRWARRDTPRAWGAPREVIAAAHRSPGLAHDGRVAGSELENLSAKAIALALADRFDYTRSTLTVVSPHPAAETLGQVMEAFADLPPAARRVSERKAATTLGSAPRLLEHADGDGGAFVWALGPSPADVLRATVWCKTLNRQGRAESEPGRARVRCHLDEDARRGAVIVRASGVEDPIDLLTDRLRRIEDGTDAALVDKQREVVLDRERFELRTPLPLARRLAQTQSAVTAGSAVTERPLEVLTGLDALAPGAGLQREQELSIAAAVRVVGPKAEGS